MQEYLFRGKRKDNGEWVEGDFYKVDILCFIIPRSSSGTYSRGKHTIKDVYPCYEVIPETVGQYTGLTDKKGTKIFKGDIIRTITFGFDKEKSVTEIKFGARYGVQGFYLANGRNMFYFGQTNLSVMDDTEVIGNIHDNPELLKGA